MSRTITINDDNFVWLNEIKLKLFKGGQPIPTYDDVLKEIKHWVEVGKNAK